MRYEIVDNDIIFEVDVDQLGKWVIVESLEQVLNFWKNVRHYAVFKRQAFDSVIIKITGRS